MEKRTPPPVLFDRFFRSRLMLTSGFVLVAIMVGAAIRYVGALFQSGS